MKLIKKFIFLIVIFLALIVFNIPSTKANSNFDEIVGGQTFVIDDLNTSLVINYANFDYLDSETASFKLYYDKNNLDYSFDFSIEFAGQGLGMYIEKNEKMNESLYDYLYSQFDLEYYDIDLLMNYSVLQNSTISFIDFSVILHNAKRLLGVSELYLYCDHVSEFFDVSLYDNSEHGLIYVDYYLNNIEDNSILIERKIYDSGYDCFFEELEYNSYLSNFSILGYYSMALGKGEEFIVDETLIQDDTSVYILASSNYVTIDFNTNCEIVIDSIIVDRYDLDYTVLSHNLTRDGYSLVGWSIFDINGNEVMLKDYTHLVDIITSEDCLFINEFTLTALWSKDLSLNVNEKNSVLYIKTPSLDSTIFTFSFFIDNEESYVCYVFYQDDGDNFVLEIDETSGLVSYFNASLIDYEVIHTSYGYYNVYIDFTRQIQNISENLKIFNLKYYVYADFKCNIDDNTFTRYYAFEISNYRNLKTYYIPTYNFVDGAVEYIPSKYSMSSTINFSNDTDKIYNKMYYYKNGRKVEINEGDILNGNYNIYVDLVNVVTFVNNNDTFDTIVNVLLDSPVKEPTKPTRVAYNFVGWYSDEDLSIKYDFTQQVTDDIVLYAKWEPMINTITFNSVGGTFVEDLKAQVYSDIEAPTSPTKHGYTFGGWYLNTLYTQEYLFTIMPAYNLTLVAKWNPVEVTLTFYSDDEENYIYTQIFEFGKSQELASNMFVREGYTFVGWNTKADGTGKKYTNKQVLQISPSTLNVVEDEDHPNVLYAMWEEGSLINTPSISTPSPDVNNFFNTEVTWYAFFAFIGFIAVLAVVLKRR